MDKNQPTAKNRLIFLALLAIGVAVGLFVWWTAARVDREIRANLLQQARLVVQAVDVQAVKALTGTAADVNSLPYQRLKEQLAATRSVNPNCRFVYIMGRKADGTVFFFVDSEAVSSKDYSPPGQVYDEVPAAYRRVFDTGTAAVAGPVTDRWGAWVSALVPLTDHSGGPVIGVLGMDIDTRSWKREIIEHTALPGGLMLTLLLLGLIYVLLRGTHTTMRAQQMALRESEEKFRLLVENTHDIIYAVAADGVLVFVSPAWTRLLGHPVDQVVGESFQTFVHPDDVPRCAAFARSMLETGQPQESVEYRVRHSDGTWLWHDSKGVPYRDQTGAAVGFYGVARDITERKKREEDLHQLVAELQKAIEEIKTLKGIVPICANCKKIRNDEGFWDQVESYVARHTEARFSHGICPDCILKLYPEYAEEQETGNEQSSRKV